MNRLDYADGWWAGFPKVSEVFSDRVHVHGLHRALDMTIGFEWRNEQVPFLDTLRPVRRAPTARA